MTTTASHNANQCSAYHFQTSTFLFPCNQCAALFYCFHCYDFAHASCKRNHHIQSDLSGKYDEEARCRITRGLHVGKNGQTSIQPHYQPLNWQAFRACKHGHARAWPGTPQQGLQQDSNGSPLPSNLPDMSETTPPMAHNLKSADPPVLKASQPYHPPSPAHPKAIRPFARLSNIDDNDPPPNATQSDPSLCRAHRHPSMPLNAALEHSFIFILICMLFRQGMEAEDAQRRARPL
jgi:hypothetical protein